MTTAEPSRRQLREVARLLERHPRSVWRTQPSLRTALWLDAHDGLRRQCRVLEWATDGALRPHAAAALAPTVGPPLHQLLATLAAHHRVEDCDYFPTLRGQVPALAALFDSLGEAHHALDDDAARALAALAEFEAALRHREGATLELAAGRCRAASARLCQSVDRHLREEEDIVVPLLLELEATE